MTISWMTSASKRLDDVFLDALHRAGAKIDPLPPDEPEDAAEGDSLA